LIAAAMLCANDGSPSVRVIRFADAQPFRMGKVTSNRIVHPGIGAKKTTLNYSVSNPGDEFAQHTHGESDDTILVLEGDVNLRQGDSLRLFRAGECAFVPGGQIHGTVTAGTKEAIMISFQTPPDFALYTGARDSTKAGAAPPKGAITPGAVKYIRFDDKNGVVTSPAMGSMKGGFAHRKLKKGESLKAKVAADGEHVLFVKSGSVKVTDKAGSRDAAAKDAIFATGPVEFEVTAASPDTVVIHIQAPFLQK
jgi:quercetin dioxygenase-like cupin family protein